MLVFCETAWGGSGAVDFDDGGLAIQGGIRTGHAVEKYVHHRGVCGGISEAG